MSISIVRHGDARYQNLHVSADKTKYKGSEVDDFCSLVEENKDLRPEKIVDLEKNISSYIDENYENLKDKELLVWVSPFGRTLETAQKLIEGLKNHELAVKSISIVEQLQEVKGFSWFVFKTLVDGGTIKIDDKEVLIDKTITNPKNLTTTDYFFEGSYRDIPDEYLEGLGIREKIKSIETYKEISQRSRQDLGRILGAVAQNQHVFIVSHQAFTDWIYVEKEGYKNGGQLPGTFLPLTKEDFMTLVSV